MTGRFGVDSGDLRAAIGPGIGACCYQVGDEVARQFGLSGTSFLDLAAENRRQLLEVGLAEANIDLLNQCTFCHTDRFHSYRRDKEHAGRMISYALIR